MSKTAKEKSTYSLISVEKADSVKDGEESSSAEGPQVQNAPTQEVRASDTSVSHESTNTDRLESALDELTEQDLESDGPLENVHRILIVVLLLLLVGFGVYYVMFM